MGRQSMRAAGDRRERTRDAAPRARELGRLGRELESPLPRPRWPHRVHPAALPRLPTAGADRDRRPAGAGAGRLRIAGIARFFHNPLLKRATLPVVRSATQACPRLSIAVAVAVNMLILSMARARSFL